MTRLAVGGDKRALELLRKYFGHENFSIRRAAIQGYIEAAGPNARDELRRSLPEGDQFILDIRRADVHDVPQPRLELRSDDKHETPPARIQGRPKIEE